MPFKLCHSEKKRLNELIDHVRELSDTVDELRAEVDAIKISSIVASNENLNQRRNRTEASTLHKLKRCLEKSLTPVFSRDPTYSVRKKCQQMFSQFPTIISRPADLPGKEDPAYQHFSSSYAKDDGRSTRKIPRTRYLDEAKAKRREKNIPSPLQRQKKIRKNSGRDESLQISESSSTNSENSSIEPYKSYNPYCTNETCSSMKSSRKNQDVGKLEKKLVKKKTAETSTSTSPVKSSTPQKEIIDLETLKHQRSVTFVDGEKKTQLEKDSSLSSSFLSSDTSGHLQDCNVIYAKPKTDVSVKRTTNITSTGPERKKKTSRSAQCSKDCEYLNKLPSQKKDIFTSTDPQNLSQKESLKRKKIKKVRRENLATQETQTSLKLNKHREEICSTNRRRYCPKAKRTCFSQGSLSSLTSCSPRSISSFCLDSEQLGEGLMSRYYKREPSPEVESIEKKRKLKVSEKETDKVEKLQPFSSREATKNIKKEKNMKPRNIRKKRTYVISDSLTRQTDEADQCNLDEQQHFSLIGDSKFQDRQLKEPKSRKKWKKPEAPQKVYQGHQLWNNHENSPEKRDKDHRTERFYPKSQRLSTQTTTTQKNPTKLSKFSETSSSSAPCTDETCSLTSNPSLSRSNTSLTSETFDRREKPIKDFNAFVR